MTIRVRVTEDILRDTDRVTGTHHDLRRDDRVTVSRPCGERWCGLGWARDLSGEVPTGERRPGVRSVVPEDARHHAEG